MATTAKQMQSWAREALRHVKDGDAQGGLAVFFQRAESGDPVAMCGLYQLYANGIGVPKNKTTARSWLMKAAALRYGPALHTLSGIYAEGDGVEADFGRTIQLCEEAGQAGDADGYISLGLCYERGTFGNAVDLDRARAYFTKASDMGSARGKFHLGRLYFVGKGTQRDLKKAFALIEASAAAEDEEGLNALAEICANGSQGYPEDQSKALSLYRRAARLGFEPAMHSVLEYPPIVQLGAMSCSPNAARLHQNDMKFLFDKHKHGIWGDVSPEDWDRNDRALTNGEPVYSVHRSEVMTVLIQTDGARRATYMELENEDHSSGHGGIFETIKHVKEGFEWWHFAKEIFELVKR